MLRLRQFLPALLLTATLPGSGWAEMTPDEREEFRDEVRAYLLDNPEVLSEMASLLDARQRDATVAMDRERIEAQSQALFEDGFSLVAGNPEGSVTIVEFLDYQCGYCRRAHPDLAKMVESDGDIRWIIKEWPVLGPASDYAARAAVATGIVAGSEAYAALNDRLMRLDGPVTEARVAGALTEVGVDPAAVRAEMDSPEVTRRIEATRTLATALALEGTPSFVFGDKLLRGLAPIAAMEQLVDEMRLAN